MRAIVTDHICPSCSQGFLVGDEMDIYRDLYCNNCFKYSCPNPPLLLEEFDLEDTLDTYMDELFKGAD